MYLPQRQHQVDYLGEQSSCGCGQGEREPWIDLNSHFIDMCSYMDRIWSWQLWQSLLECNGAEKFHRRACSRNFEVFNKMQYLVTPISETRLISRLWK